MADSEPIRKYQPIRRASIAPATSVAPEAPGMVEGYSRGKPAITRAYTDTVLNIDRAGRNQKSYENTQGMALGFILLAGCLGIGILKSLGVF